MYINVVMAYIIYDNKLLFVKHNKENRFMSCGGKVKPYELFSEALKREVKEEINLDIDFIRTNKITSIDQEPLPFLVSKKYNKNKQNLQIFEYIATTKSIDNILLKKNEISDYVLLSYNEVINSEIINESIKNICHLIKSSYSNLI